ncbi:Elongation of very long chain fatty acids protein 4 [Araneus ventricosus]|uniref:Elongation of very long chain fatty acids protein n=1 Tax=Araneus ventricosus TaxID=182803 RepID=A0A4Y2NJ07_ARAVE|nr:Elongation of very long chain fatty acids protein 4 [Araneus ventricosus]
MLGRSFGRRVLSNATLRSLRQYPVEPIVNEIVYLAKIRGLEVDSNDIDELVEEHNLELTTERLYGVALCITARSYGGVFLRGGGESHFCNMLVVSIQNFLSANGIGKHLNENVHQCYCILVGYVLFVTWIGPSWMKNRKPFELKIPMIVYNFFMSAFNLILVHQLYATVTENWDMRCSNRSIIEYQQRVHSRRHVAWNLIFEKYLSLLDTVFFVLRKKQNQISFLHVFHHASMCLLVIWCATTPDPAFFIIINMLLNTFVHIIMYFYYGLSAFGKSIQKYLWWKRHLTLLQIIQFLLMISYMTISFGKGCEEVKTLEAVSSAFTFSILVLFINFYQKSFKKSKVQ